MFEPLNLQPADLKISKRNGVFFVWDVWRNKSIQLTPEEWVRQQLLHNMVDCFNYPTQRIAVEMQIEVNNLKRRCDAVVYDSDGRPKMIVECKEPNVVLNEAVVYQIAQYNAKLNAEWLLISNGLQHITMHVQQEPFSCDFHEGIVDYNEL